MIDDNFGSNQLFGDQGDDVLDGTDGHSDVELNVSVAEYCLTDTFNSTSECPSVPSNTSSP